jgi:hypothetical protein
VEGRLLRTFNNDTDRGVPFGESSDDEMCYQFALAYPAHALGNGASSLLGQAGMLVIAAVLSVVT